MTSDKLDDRIALLKAELAELESAKRTMAKYGITSTQSSPSERPASVQPMSESPEPGAEVPSSPPEDKEDADANDEESELTAIDRDLASGKIKPVDLIGKPVTLRHLAIHRGLPFHPGEPMVIEGMSVPHRDRDEPPPRFEFALRKDVGSHGARLPGVTSDMFVLME